MKAWHFLMDDKRCAYGNFGAIQVGQTLTAEGPLKLCANGLHASFRLTDALGYAQGSMLCRVDLGGEIIKGEGKAVARSREVLWMGDVSALLHRFACDEAERALDAGKNVDPRSKEALRVKRLWLAGKASDDELAAASAAASAADWNAARAAARAADWNAARAAARAADWNAARAAASAAASAAPNRRLTARVYRYMKSNGEWA